MGISMTHFHGRILGLALACCGLAAIPASAATFTVLHDFTGLNQGDGDTPDGPLILHGGLLYGTTIKGGSSLGTGCSVVGCGTIFTVTPTGALSIVYALNGGAEGANPIGGVTPRNGSLFAGTQSCGLACPNGNGTILAWRPSGYHKVVYSFPDNFFPTGHLAAIGSTLYGLEGNSAYSVTTAGVESLVYTFQGGTDGSTPSDLQVIGGALVGTTGTGGGGNCFLGIGCGTVFTLTPGGAEQVLYAFQGGSDGAYPQGRLAVGKDGTLYGTTNYGGAYGYGTVFSVTAAGVETILHSFSGFGDGAYPQGGLTRVSGTLYGTTSSGGGCAANLNGCGTVFSVTPAGVKTVLYYFQGGTDGGFPLSSLLYVGGALYGTTSFNGDPYCHCGTVFSITP
jgi:uncharacterized repeat protein (TIGR03803 family)